MDDKRNERHTVTFRKPPDMWIEVTLCAPRKDAVEKARSTVQSIPGLIYCGCN